MSWPKPTRPRLFIMRSHVGISDREAILGVVRQLHVVTTVVLPHARAHFRADNKEVTLIPHVEIRLRRRQANVIIAETQVIGRLIALALDDNQIAAVLLADTITVLLAVNFKDNKGAHSLRLLQLLLRQSMNTMNPIYRTTRRINRIIF